MFSQGSTQNLNRCLFPLHLIKEGIVRKNTNFNLADIAGDERLLALLPPKNSNYYPLSDFFKEFNDFDLTKKEFVNFHGFENEEYKYKDVEINNIFFLHILHRNEDKTYYSFDFLPIFNYTKEYEIGQSFEDTFYTYLDENGTDVFTTEAKYLNGEKKKILYILDKEKNFRFLDKEFQKPGIYGAYHYISESFYSIVLTEYKFAAFRYLFNLV